MTAVVRFSIVMALYNGKAHVNEQLHSIIDDMAYNDQLIIVDDCSTDGSLEIIEDIQDARVTLLRHQENRGHVRTFEFGMSAALGRYVALADQDDVWPRGRLDRLECALEDTLMVASSLEFLAPSSPDRPLRFVDDRCAHWSSRVGNIVRLVLGRIPYYGSAMAYRVELNDLLLPMPTCVEAHDHWLAIVGNMMGPVRHLSSAGVYRRVHSSNLSQSHRPMLEIVRTRAIHVRMIMLCARRWLGRKIINAERIAL